MANFQYALRVFGDFRKQQQQQQQKDQQQQQQQKEQQPPPTQPTQQPLQPKQRLENSKPNQTNSNASNNLKKRQLQPQQPSTPPPQQQPPPTQPKPKPQLPLQPKHRLENSQTNQTNSSSSKSLKKQQPQQQPPPTQPTQPKPQPLQPKQRFENSQQNQTNSNSSKNLKKRNKPPTNKNAKTTRRQHEHNDHQKPVDHNRKHILLKSGYRRDSFDRFCDDLCEVLLSHSSLDDRIKHECVSKQWRRCVFRTQRVLVFNDLKHYENRTNKFDINKVMKSLDICVGVTSHQKLFVIIENVLRKCEFVRHITIDFYRYVFNTRLLRIIADNCRYLETIELKRFRFIALNDDLIYFGRKCGQKLLKIRNDSRKLRAFSSLLKYCPNLLSLDYILLTDLTDRRINKCDDESVKLLPKLREVKHIYECDKTGLMRAFVDRYADTLKSFDSTYDGKDCEEVFGHISNLRNLEKLCLVIRPKRCYSSASLQLDSNFNAIGQNCTKLSELRLKFADGFNVAINANIILNALKHFTALKQMSVQFNLYNDCDLKHDKYHNIDANIFKHCHRLTHVTLSSIIDDSFFTTISLYLPNLKALDVTTNKLISDNAMRCLSKLVRLRAIRIENTKSDNSLITDSGVCDVIANCGEIRSFSFKPIPNITGKTIDALITIAVTRPRTYFSHQFDGCNAIYSRIDVNELCDRNLPNNLTLDIKRFIFEWP